MGNCMTPEQAMDFVQRHGVVLVSARGAAPRLTEAIAGEPIAGSWWSHPQGKRIFSVLNAVTESGQVLVCRLAGGKLTLVHRRLWPALVRIAGRLRPAQLAQVQERHTAGGRHETVEVPFPQWVPQEVLAQGRRADEAAALAVFGQWIETKGSKHGD
jgi:hypothetical protein